MAKVKLKATGDYRVKTKKYIAAGNVHRISPSNGFCDIESGLVVVKLVGTVEDIYAEEGRVGSRHLVGQDFDSWELPKETIWVVYAYTRLERDNGHLAIGDEQSTYILPIEEFADHISRV